MRMRWRGVILALLLGPIMTQAATDPSQQRTVLGSIGLEGVRVERGYAPSPLGQIHYQDVGVAKDGQPIYVLFHQVPWFHIYYSRAQAELAKRGIRSIAFDTPGYGLSSRPSQPPSIADYVTALRAALAHLKVDRAVVVGHHTGVTLGVELARRTTRLMARISRRDIPSFLGVSPAAPTPCIGLCSRFSWPGPTSGSVITPCSATTWPMPSKN